MVDADNPKLRLESLHERHIGLTPALSDTFFEAASVCLSRHHDSPLEMEIACNGRKSIRLVEFQKPDVRMLNAWANDIDTTESGAYGVCLAAVESRSNWLRSNAPRRLPGRIGTSLRPGPNLTIWSVASGWRFRVLILVVG